MDWWRDRRRMWRMGKVRIKIGGWRGKGRDGWRETEGAGECAHAQ